MPDQSSGLLWNDCTSQQERLTDAIYLEFCEAFDTVPNDILISKIGRYGFEVWTILCTGIWLDRCSQRALVNGSASRWRPVMGGVPQGSTPGLVLFNTLMNDSVRSDVSSAKSAEDMKLKQSRKLEN